MTPADRALLDRFNGRSVFYVRIAFPCLPSALGLIIECALQHLRAHGRGLKSDEQQGLAGLLQRELAAGFANSPASMLVLEMENDPRTPTRIKFAARVEPGTAYAGWTQPTFGESPDAKALATAKRGMRVLDVGAGAGRNAAALLALGCQVDAIELEPSFYDVLKQRVPGAQLGDFFTLSLGQYDLVLLSEVVSSHAPTPEVLTRFFARSKALLAPGGQVLASLFLADPGLAQSQLVREMGAHVLTCVFTPDELHASLQRAGLKLISNEALLPGEKQQATAWPPTEWFENWALGRNLLAMAEPPISLRWIVAA